MAENAVEAALNRASQEQKEQNQKDIAEARQTLSHLEMKDVNTVSPPPPPMGAPNPYRIDRVQIDPETQANIESVGQFQANKEIRENAMDRAMDRQSSDKEMPQVQRSEQQRER